MIRARPSAVSAALISGLVVLVVAISLQVFSPRDLSAGDTRSHRAVGHLTGKLPTSIAGWQARDEPLGASEAMTGQVAAVLNYDDYVYRVFTRGDVHLGLYVAYWRRDRMPVSRVTSHTPDRCWTANGWNCESMQFDEVVVLSDSRRLQPAQGRLFVSPANTQEHVLFWHLVEGKAYDFGDRFTSFTHPGKWLRDTLLYATLGSAEQYFVRLTSNRSFSELRGDPGFQEVLRALAGLGLAVPPKAGG